MSKRRKQNVIKGLVYGSVAGAAGAFAMDCYWKVVQSVMGERPEQKPKKWSDNEQKDEPSTQIVADKVLEAVTGHEVPNDEKAAAGVGVHYSTGMSLGGVFGALAARNAGLGLLAGLFYGIGVLLALDEITLRVLRVGPEAEEVPLSQHAQALGAHLVYGACTALVSRLLLRLL